MFSLSIAIASIYGNHQQHDIVLGCPTAVSPEFTYEKLFYTQIEGICTWGYYEERKGNSASSPTPHRDAITLSCARFVSSHF